MKFMLENSSNDDGEFPSTDLSEVIQSDSKMPLTFKNQHGNVRHCDRSLPGELSLWAANLSLSPQTSRLTQSPMLFKGDGVPKSISPDLEMLRRVSEIGEQQKHRSTTPGKENMLVEVERVNNFAPPVSPLRERDLAALEDLFHQDNIYTVEVDVTQMLLRLLPEPCWEEDPFEFLQDFLCKAKTG